MSLQDNATQQIYSHSTTSPTQHNTTNLTHSYFTQHTHTQHGTVTTHTTLAYTSWGGSALHTLVSWIFVSMQKVLTKVLTHRGA